MSTPATTAADASPVNAAVPPEGRRRFGVRSRLLGAFILVTMLSVMATGLAFWSNSRSDSTLDQITTDSIPTITALSSLALEANALMASAPALIGVGNPVQLEAERLRLAEQEEQLLRATRGVLEQLGDQAAADRLSIIGGRMNANLKIMVSAVGHRLDLAYARERRATVIDVAAQDLVRVMADVPGVEALRMDLEDWVQALERLGRAEYPVELDAMRADVLDAADIAAASLATVPAAFGRQAADLRLRLDEIVAAPDALFNDRRREIEATRLARAMLLNNRDLAKQLNVEIEEMLVEARGEVGANVAAALAQSNNSKTMLAISSGIGLMISIGVGWIYVSRRVTERLRRLSHGMRRLARGELDAPIDDRGNDEIGEMGAAMAVFRAAMRDLQAAQTAEFEATRRLDDALTHTSHGLALFDAEERLVLANAKFREFLPAIAENAVRDMRFDELMGISVARGDIATDGRPEEWLRARREAWRAAAGGFEFRLHDGRWIGSVDTRTPEGGTVSSLTEITDLKQREHEKITAQRLIRSVFETLPHGLAVWTDKYVLLDWNDQFVRLFDLPPHLVHENVTLEELIRFRADRGDFGAGDRAEIVRDLMARILTGQGPAEYRVAGLERLLEVNRHRLPQNRILTSYADITEQRQAEARAQRMTTHDVLTGLPNRIAFQDQLAKAVAAADLGGRAGAVMVADLKGFRALNETMGSMVGDQVLRQVGNDLRALCGDTELPGRLDSNEFGLLLTQVSGPADVTATLDRWRQVLDGGLVIEGREIRLRADIGIALFPQDGDDEETLLRKAEVALNRAKSAPAAATRYYTPERGGIAERPDNVTDLRAVKPT